MLQNEDFIPKRMSQCLWLHLLSTRFLPCGCPPERGVLFALIRCTCSVLKLFGVQKALSLAGSATVKYMPLTQARSEGRGSEQEKQGIYIFVVAIALNNQKKIKITLYDGLCSMIKKHVFTRFFLSLFKEYFSLQTHHF